MVELYEFLHGGIVGGNNAVALVETGDAEQLCLRFPIENLESRGRRGLAVNCR